MRDFTLSEIEALVPEARRLEPTGDPWLDARFRWEAETSHQPKPYYKLLWELPRVLEVRYAVELGAWRGIGAAHLAAGGAGVVVTIDHHSDPGDEENRAWCLEAAEQYTNIEYLQGWTREPWVVDRVRELGRPDLLFIDSWHNYDEAMADFRTYLPLLADRALVICDDIADFESPTISGMQRFWDDLPGADWAGTFDKWLAGTALNTYQMGFLKLERAA